MKQTQLPKPRVRVTLALSSQVALEHDRKDHQKEVRNVVGLGLDGLNQPTVGTEHGGLLNQKGAEKGGVHGEHGVDGSNVQCGDEREHEVKHTRSKCDGENVVGWNYGRLPRVLGREKGGDPTDVGNFHKFRKVTTNFVMVGQSPERADRQQLYHPKKFLPRPQRCDLCHCDSAGTFGAAEDEGGGVALCDPHGSVERLKAVREERKEYPVNPPLWDVPLRTTPVVQGVGAEQRVPRVFVGSVSVAARVQTATVDE